MYVMLRDLHKSGLLQAQLISRTHASGFAARLALLPAVATGYSGLDGRRDIFIASDQFIFYAGSSIQD
jgi:hypothetical protein